MVYRLAVLWRARQDSEPATRGLGRPLLYPAELRAHFEVMAGRDAMLVGAEGFEPPTSCSQSRCATRLRHAPQPLTAG